MGLILSRGLEIEYGYYTSTHSTRPQTTRQRSAVTFYITDENHASHPDLAGSGPHDGKAHPPIKIIAPGRVYRSDEVDATHSPLFHRLEAWSSTNISQWET